MLELSRLLSTDGFMPHGMCYMWRPALLALHVGSDALIALAYFTIPFTLMYFARKRADLRFSWILLSFAIFIVACGASHVMEIWTIWFPMYWLSGAIKLITALASVITALLLIKLVPPALRFPSHSALQAANDELAYQVIERQAAQQTVIELNASLEARVAERTEQLAQSEERFRSLANAIPQMAHIARADGSRVWYNQRWYDYTGTTPEQMAGTGWRCVHEPEVYPGLMVKWTAAIAAAEPFEMEFPLRRDDGSYRLFMTLATPQKNAGGQVIQWIATHTDITERKRATEQFRLALEAAPTGMLMMNDSGTIVLVNEQIEAVFGYPREELLGQRLEMLVPERFRAHHPDRRQFYFEAPKTRVMGAGRELYGLRKDGTEVPIEIGLNPLQTSEGNFVLSSIADITERKRADEAQRAVASELEQRIITRTLELKERDSLLQEVHHRVKNNLQVISSLINMQIRGLDDESSRVALRDCQSRVLTMAEIHQMLYQSADYARVPFAKYAKDLALRILSASGTSPGNITLHFDIEEFSLPVAQAIPCGLILNELVANSLKHAFPNDAHGSIRLQLRLAADESVFLSVDDDGIGIAPEMDLENITSLGVQLVVTLVEQLEGRLDIIRRPGSTFQITFPLECAA